MKRLIISATILLLFVSGWTNALAAAFCPHMQATHACCFAKNADQQHGHSNDGMVMDGMSSMETPASPAQATANENVNALGDLQQECIHCMGYSQPTAATIVIGGVDQSKRDLSTTTTPPATPVTQFVSLFTSPVSSRQHAPPDGSTSRHVLISVFRI